MWDFGEESAPTDPAGLTIYDAATIAALGPAEDVLGNLADCEIEHDAREQVLGEMTVARQSDIGVNE
eukprot:12939126-Heterocapsa_arctica.AAC.1